LPLGLSQKLVSSLTTPFRLIERLKTGFYKAIKEPPLALIALPEIPRTSYRNIIISLLAV